MAIIVKSAIEPRKWSRSCRARLILPGVAGAAAVLLADAALAQSATRTRLISSPNPSNFGQWMTLTAEVDALGGGAPPFGSVVFRDNAVRFGEARLVAIGAGQATLTGGVLHTCALTSAGGVKCWGANFMGQLGDGTTAFERLNPVPVVGLTSGAFAVVAGDFHNCALTTAGGVKCWGANDYGEIGDGTFTDRLTPVPVVGLSTGVVAIAAGDAFSCALTSAGGVKCWGANGYGQLGDGTNVKRNTPVAVVGLSSGVVAIEAGGSHACALTSLGAVKCWGMNEYGELGDGTRTNRLSPVSVVGLSSGAVALSAGGNHTCALTSARGAKCWGANGYGQLGDGTNTMRLTPVPVVGLSSGVVAITTDFYHTCAVTSVGAVKCWGYNAYGQLGDGTNVNRNTPVSVVGLSSWVAAVGSGYFHNCALNRAAVVGCWGENESGQIGDRTHRNRWTPVPVASFSGLVRSRAIFATRTLGVGAHTLQAIFPGEALHGPSVGQTTHTVR